MVRSPQLCLGCVRCLAEMAYGCPKSCTAPCAYDILEKIEHVLAALSVAVNSVQVDVKSE